MEAQANVLCNTTKLVTLLLKIKSFIVFVSVQDRVYHNTCLFSIKIIVSAQDRVPHNLCLFAHRL